MALEVGRYQRGSAQALPYDHFVPRPIAQTTRTITIDAPAEEVWRWLVQLGQGRSGLYSYDWLENRRILRSIAPKRSTPSCRS